MGVTSAAQVFGIVNMTTDSFSDGGQFLAPERAIARARALMDDGAAAIDVGPVSSNPASGHVGAAEQIRRISPVLDALERDGVPVSIDSGEPETQRFAIARGVAFLNDISGFPHESLYADLARASCRLIVMHSVQGQGPATIVEGDAERIWSRIYAFFDARVAALTSAGIARRRLILDPGMGYFLGDGPEPSLRVLANIEAIRIRYGLDVMVSVSRKSFLRRLTGRDVAACGPATLAAELEAVRRGVGFIRTHDVGALVDACKVWQALAAQPLLGQQSHD